MNILLIAATASEISPFLKTFQDKGFDGLDILITGPGLTSTTYHLLKQIQLKRPELVIQAGIAGSFDKKMETGTVLTVKRDCLADEGVWEKSKFKTVFDLQLRNKNDKPFIKGWLENPHQDLLKNSGLKAVNAITVNQVTTTDVVINEFLERYNCSLESMEGAAFHYVCLMENIPFIQIRGISNFIGERNKQNWKMEQAIVNLNLNIEQLITTILKG